MLLRLRLRNFRCYPTLNWEIPAEGALLYGDNAQGKTSLMEAICFAQTLHSPRTTRLERLAMHHCTDFGISLDTDEGTRKIVWQDKKLTLGAAGSRRKDYTDYLADARPVVWLGNTDITLVTGSAELRRDYLDFLGSQWHPAYRPALLEYRKALKSRNMLLRNPRQTPAALRSYAAILARNGEILRNLRERLVQLLRPYVAQLHLNISTGKEDIGLFYRPCTSQSLAEAIDQSTQTDIRAGFTTIGPHRDDFELTIQGHSATAFASEGQQRTLATALVLAQSALLQEQTGHAPTILIDDVFGELDPPRRRALLSQLPQDSQVFITTTHTDWLADTPAPLPLLRICDATVAPKHKQNGVLRNISEKHRFNN